MNTSSAVTPTVTPTVTTRRLGRSHRSTTLHPRCGRPRVGSRMRRPSLAGPPSRPDTPGARPATRRARPAVADDRRSQRRAGRAGFVARWRALADLVVDATPSRRALAEVAHLDRSPRA